MSTLPTPPRFLLPVLVSGWLLATAGAIPSWAQQPDFTDQAITDKIEDELAADPGVVASRVNVSTEGGIVTLSGRIHNVLAQERAARIASTVRGVRSVINRITVTPLTSRTDDEIAQDVENALFNDPATDAYEITVVVKNGVVDLSGTVDSFRERELVKTVAQGVRGIQKVNDRITVDYTSDRPDAELQTEIEQALKWNVHVNNGLINVQVNDGKAVLTGKVGSAFEKAEAVTTALVSGVHSVESSGLEVVTNLDDDKLRGNKFVFQSQDEIKEAIQDAMRQDPRVAAFKVDVELTGSTVTLRGVVDNLKAKQAAEQDARNTTGVGYVVNRIRVRDDGAPSDRQIADNLRSAIGRDPYLERFDTYVSVINGTAYLYGTVDSRFEKRRANELASRLHGVIDVRNYLRVDDTDYYLYDPYVEFDYQAGDDLTGYERRSPAKGDWELKRDIESELWWSPFVDEDEVTVSVDNGIATLTGTVDSWSEHRSATENAYEGGATLVDNNLKVAWNE